MTAEWQVKNQIKQHRSTDKASEEDWNLGLKINHTEGHRLLKIKKKKKILAKDPVGRTHSFYAYQPSVEIM